MRAVFAFARREIALAWNSGGPVLGVGFFTAMTVMFPLSLGSSPAALAPVAPGVAWVGLILSSLLSLDRMFERDMESGALDFLALGRTPLELVGLVKCLAHWLTCGVPLSLAAPIASIALGGAPSSAIMLIVCGLVGSLAFALVGGTGAALAISSRRGGVLVALVVLPLLTPPVIFGGAAIERVVGGAPWGAALALLCAYAAAALAGSPFAIAAACRNSLS